MDIKQILKFEGTMTRTEWWITSLVLLAGYGIVFVLGAAIASIAPILGIVMIAGVMFFYPYANIAINKARANDAGWNGWVQIVPILNLVVIGFFGTVKKTKKRAKKKK